MKKSMEKMELAQSFHLKFDARKREKSQDQWMESSSGEIVVARGDRLRLELGTTELLRDSPQGSVARIVSDGKVLKGHVTRVHDPKPESKPDTRQTATPTGLSNFVVWSLVHLGPSEPFVRGLMNFGTDGNGQDIRKQMEVSDLKSLESVQERGRSVAIVEFKLVGENKRTTQEVTVWIGMDDLLPVRLKSVLRNANEAIEYFVKYEFSALDQVVKQSDFKLPDDE